MARYRFGKEQLEFMEKSLVPFAIYQFVERRVVTLVISDGFLRLFKYEDKEQAYYDMDHNMYRETELEDIARISEAAYRFATEGGEFNVVYRSRKADESDYTMIHAVGEHFYTDTGVRLAVVWYMDEGSPFSGDDRDADGMNKTFKEIIYRETRLHKGYFDNLTGFPSMTYFFELAEEGCRKIKEEGSIPAFVFIDLSGMKSFNRKHGFAEGDKIIRRMAGLLARNFGVNCCSRFSGDHFAVCYDSRDVDGKLGLIFEEWRTINGGNALPIRAGVFLMNSNDVPMSTACDNAKVACDMIRNTYASRINYYNKEVQDDIEKREYIFQNIDRAIKENWLTVYYQPIVRSVNGRVCDEEALARWIDPERGFMSPADFIPALEESGLIYKLDLFVVEQIIKKLKAMEANGLSLVPQSVNLSRSDFEACDMVEEICSRVDEAGVSHSLITIEVTESMIASDFDYMREQIERFRQLGFSVWMDDFGSGYSSLDVLHELEFDLIKFDMHFLHQIEEGMNSKIILTELMRMTTALGLETVCEGVETAEHVDFLKEVGCCKLQGYFFSKPVPVDNLIEKYGEGIKNGFENPEETDYYEALGRVNLYDLEWVIRGGEINSDRYFNTIPMVIMELSDDSVRVVRSNASYRDFSNRTFKMEFGTKYHPFDTMPKEHREAFLGPLIECANTGKRMLVDERFPDNSVVHAIMRRIALNPVTGEKAVAVAILSITDER